MTASPSAGPPGPLPPAVDPATDAALVPVIEMVGVDKIYAAGSLQVAALRSVAIRIERGELVAVIGPSGSGKSTLMHIIGCLDVPTVGEFHLAGHDVAGFSENQLSDVRNRMIGFVFQQFNLLAYLSAWRNVELPLVYSRLAPDERRERALSALDKVGLADRADHRPGELSGGQQQRVAIARALVTEPALILADEPTGNLDSTSTAEVLGLLEDLHHEGRTIVLITHEHDVAARASRVIQIRDGQVWAPDGPATGRRRHRGGRAVTWRDTLRTAVEAVRTHRLRSALTMLGILIGIMAVTLSVGLGQGAQAAGAVGDQPARHEHPGGVAGQLDRQLGGPGRVRVVVDAHRGRRRRAVVVGRRARRAGRGAHVDRQRVADRRLDQLDHDAHRHDAELADRAVT